MPRPIIKGSLQPIRTSVKIRHDPSNGTTTTQEFESAGDNCHGLVKQFVMQGASVDLSSNGVRSSLVATSTKNIFTASEDIFERWELFSNQTQLDIKESPAWVSLSVAARSAILKDVAAHMDKGQSITGVRTWGEVGDGGTADAFFQLMIRGTTHFLKPQWVVRVTFNVSNDYRQPVANGGVGTIYTTSQLGAPSGRLRSTIQSISAPAAVDGLTWGWLQVSYSEVTSARNRIDVSQEFWLAQWPIILY